MDAGKSYIVKHEYGVSLMTVIYAGKYAVKVLWKNGMEEWIYLSDFKTTHSYVDPKKMIISELKLTTNSQLLTDNP